MKKFYASLAALAVVVSGVLLFNVFGTDSNAAPRDCDPNSIIYCGATSAGELKQKYTENKPGDLPTIYRHYGLSDTELKNAGTQAKMGKVHRDGRITVGDEVVATEAHSLGRQDIFPNRTKVKIGTKYYYQGQPRYTYAKNTQYITAYVFFDQNGQFKAAVMTSCGNPVKGKPKPKPVYKCEGLTEKKINRTKYQFDASAEAKNGASVVGYTYTIKDASGKVVDTKTNSSTSKRNSLSYNFDKPGKYTITVTVKIKVGGKTKLVSGPKCAVEVTVKAPEPKPKYSCDLLTVTKIDRTKFEFATDYTVENATFKELVYVIRDENGDEVASVAGPEYTQETPGTYSVQAYVTVTVKGEDKIVTDDKCKDEFTVTPPNKVEVCDPETGEIITVDEKDQDKYKPIDDEACQPKEEEVPSELPRTGPVEFIGGSLGLGALVAAGYYWHSSRRGLLSALLNR